MCTALNPRSGLFGPGKSLISRLQRDRVTEPVKLAAARMKRMPWAVYRVRRFYSAPANAIRSVDRVLLVGHLVVYAALEEMSDLVGVPLVRHEQIAGAPVRGGDWDVHRRLWVRQRQDGAYPAMEEFYTVAPAQALDKSMDRFDDTWAAHTDKLLARLESRCEAAADVVQHALTRSRFTSAS